MKNNYILGLQGGGSHGAFSAGFLSSILEDNTIEALSGASAGAINAVLVADGLLTNKEKAISNLQDFWKSISTHPIMSAMVSQLSKAKLSGTLFQMSPVQMNPMKINPLRDIVGDMIDFERLRKDPAIKLFVSATRVSDSKARIFTEADISLDAVMASTCLPRIHHSVILDGEAYWDGGYTANPPLRVMVENTIADKLILVQLTETHQDNLPTSVEYINRHLAMMPFHSALVREIESLNGLLEMMEKQQINPNSQLHKRLLDFSFHTVKAEAYGIGGYDPMSTSETLVSKLYLAGKDSFEKYCENHTKELAY